MRPENFTAATSKHAAITQFNFLSQDLIVLAQEAKVDPKVDHTATVYREVQGFYGDLHLQG